MDQFNEYELDKEDNDREESREEDQFEEDGFSSTFSDLERVSLADDCGGAPVITSGSLGDIYKEINKNTTNPEDRFKQQVGAISYNMTENKLYNITVDMRNSMCRKASDLPNIKYLNATAYILGFLASDGGRGITSKLVNRIFDILPELQDDSVKKADVIRYARFYMKISEENN